MTADGFFWWLTERQCGLTEQKFRTDPEIAAAVGREADRKSHEVVERVMAVLRSREADQPDRAAEGGGAAGVTAAPVGPTPTARRHLTAGEGLTVAGAARLLGCSPSKVYRLFDAGELRGHRVGDKRVIDPASVGEYRARHANGPAPSAAPPVPRKSGYRHLDLRPRR